ncbi:MAG: prepilin peptidase [Lachnospiraceae bacterium]|nr:prepilin peptidase [Lachnospiraceae bacterium]
MIELLCVLAVLLSVIIGTAAFSFMSTIAYRYEKGLKLNDHFRCETCETRLKAAEVLPVISYPLHKGRCKYCGEKLKVRDFLNEIVGGALAVFVFFRFGERGVIGDSFRLSSVLDVTIPMDIKKIAAIIIIFSFFCIMDLVILVDYDTMKIPDIFNIVLLVFAIASIFVVSGVGTLEHIIGAFVISLPLLVITLVIPGAFGGGDIKLSAVAGLFLGWKLSLMGFLLGLLFGGIYGIFTMASKKLKKGEHFSFGPFLGVGYMLALICGMDIINGYLSFASHLMGRS